MAARLLRVANQGEPHTVPLTKLRDRTRLDLHWPLLKFHPHQSSLLVLVGFQAKKSQAKRVNQKVRLAPAMFFRHRRGTTLKNETRSHACLGPRETELWTPVLRGSCLHSWHDREPDRRTGSPARAGGCECWAR